MPVGIESNPLDKDGKLRVQQLVRSLLYYAWAVDMTNLHTLNSIVADSFKPIECTMERVEQLLDYIHTYPNAGVRYYASDMILNVHFRGSLYFDICPAQHQIRKRAS